MAKAGSFKLFDWLLLILVLAAGGGVRAWYLCECADCGNAEPGAVRHVQAPEPSGELVPPASPGYSLAKGALDSVVSQHLSNQVTPQAAVRWVQVALGALTAGLYFALARRAFASTLVGLLAGLFYAFDPFAIINTAELLDGVVVAFLLALVLAAGARAGQTGGAISALVFGLALAGLVLARMALLPFALVTLTWFLLRSRAIHFGWLYALLAFLGFGGGVASWMVQSYQVHQDPVPLANAAWWRVWSGNNPHATGGPLDGEPKDVLGEERVKDLTEHPEKQRAGILAQSVLDEVREHPFETVERRLVAALYFFTGKADGQRGGLMQAEQPPDGKLPWLEDALFCTLIGMFFLAFLGWRWSYIWRYRSMPLQIAIIWIPLPYILSHAEALHGPRLPLDGPFLCLAALAVACLIPGRGGQLLRGQAGTAEAEAAAPPARM